MTQQVSLGDNGRDGGDRDGGGRDGSGCCCSRILVDFDGVEDFVFRYSSACDW